MPGKLIRVMPRHVEIFWDLERGDIKNVVALARISVSIVMLEMGQ